MEAEIKHALDRGRQREKVDDLLREDRASNMCFAPVNLSDLSRVKREGRAMFQGLDARPVYLCRDVFSGRPQGNHEPL